MRSRLLNNLCALFLLSSLFSIPSLWAANSAFLILKDGVNVVDEAARLETLGAFVRQRVPPQILVADFPDTLNVRSITTVKSAYATAVPLNVLQSLGPLAVAAGTQWNRSLLLSSKTAGSSGFAAMRSLVAQKSLPAPQNITVEPAGSYLHATWTPVDGALYYEAEIALDAAFTQRVALTQTNRAAADLPLPTDSGNVTVYFRARGMDHVDSDGSREEVAGGYGYSNAIALPATPDDNSLSAPTLASPIPNYVSRGFTLILEWDAIPNSLYRVQMARSDSFDATVFDTVVGESPFVCPSPGLKVGDVLYWRVRRWGDQKSGWSETRKISIDSPHSDKPDMFVNPEAPQ